MQRTPLCMTGAAQADARPHPTHQSRPVPPQTTLSSAAVFGLFLGAGSLLHCGRQSGY